MAKAAHTKRRVWREEIRRLAGLKVKLREPCPREGGSLPTRVEALTSYRLRKREYTGDVGKRIRG